MVASNRGIEKKTLLITSLGGILEFYDFIIYALLASYLAHHFFPTGNDLSSLFFALLTYAVAYVARPVGGVIFGHFGDRISRRTTFATSILMMSVSTLCIGLLPTYTAIGLFAPLLLVICRITQGLSVGGEVPGAITYLAERMPTRAGLACGVLFAGNSCGITLGAAVIAMLQMFLPSEAMHAWGWRVPFIIAGLVGIMGFRYRLALNESQTFTALRGNVAKLPFVELVKSHSKEVFYGLTLMALAATLATLLLIFLPAYLHQIVHYAIPNFMWYYTGALIVSAFIDIFVGHLSDSKNHHRIIITLCIVSIVTAYPIYLIYTTYPALSVLALFLSIIPNGIAFGLIPRMLADIFPPEVRYSGVALCYSLGFAIFGGIIPLVATALVYEWHSQEAPAVIIISLALMTLVIECIYKKKQMLCPNQ